MKKSFIVIAILLGFIITGTVSADPGPLSDYLDTQTTAAEQWGDVVAARADLQELTTLLFQKIADVNEIKESGSFNTVNADYRSLLITWLNLFEQLETAIKNNANIMEVYNWAP